MRTINFKHFVATSILLLLCTSSWSADDDTFTANTVEGVSMTFQVISESEKTCQVGNGNSPAIPSDYAGAITIPSSANGYNVTRIGNNAFEYGSSLTSITISEGVTNIGPNAFYNCSKLASITIPSSVTSIGGRAFYNCSGLTSINIPDGVTSIGEKAFFDCFGLTSITIPSSVTSIGSQAFNNGCSSLTSVIVDGGNPKYDSRENCNAIIETNSNTLIAGCKNTIIPSSVTSIGDFAFYFCTGLTYISIPEGVTSIGYRAFYYCSGLTSINIPEGVTSIGNLAFYYCSGLTSITISSGVTRIGREAFQSCSGLSSITIPEGVTSIGEAAFGGCKGLTSITIPSSVTSIGDGAFYWCSGLTSIIVDEGNSKYDSRENCNAIIETSSNTLIAGCKNTSIPSSVTGIGVGAFGGSGLTSITIPSGVTSIDQSAFAYCSNLASVVSEIVTPFAFGSYAFTNISSSCVLTIPYGTRDAYIAAGWTDDVFKGGIVEMPKVTSSLAISDASGLVGCTFTLPISMTNEDEITAMQFELSLPEGVSVASAALTDRKNDHSIGYSQKGNGNYQFTVFSGASKAFSGNEGIVANISLSISNSMAAGNYTIQLKNIELTTTAGDGIKPSDLSATLTVSNIKQGDVNGDGNISITDAVGIVNYILGHASSNFHPEAADLNGDNNISITDAVRVVNIILNQGSAGVKEKRIFEQETEREPQ